MKILIPRKELVNQVWLYTKDINSVVERKFFMGNWGKDITKDHIERFLKKNTNLLISMLTASAIGGESKIDVVMIPVYIETGVIFEHTNEYVGFFKTGLTPEEFYDYTEFVEGIGNEKLQSSTSYSESDGSTG